jgi:copper chaperone
MTTSSTTRVYDVPEISCEHCKRAIEDEVTSVDGVSGVEVDVEAKTVHVDGPVDDGPVVDAIKAAGYENVSVR